MLVSAFEPNRTPSGVGGRTGQRMTQQGMRTAEGWLLAILLAGTFGQASAQLRDVFPPQCDGPRDLDLDYQTYERTISLHMLRHLCSAIAPDTLPAIDRVITHYRERNPECADATLTANAGNIAVVEAAQAGYIEKFRQDQLPPGEHESILAQCHDVEMLLAEDRKTLRLLEANGWGKEPAETEK